MPNAFHYQNSFEDNLSSGFRKILSVDFVPPSANALQLWFDTSDTKTRIKNENGYFINLLDKSGNNRHAYYTDDFPNRISANMINSMPALEFTNDKFIIPNINIAPPITSFAVVKPFTSEGYFLFPIYHFIDGLQFDTTGRKPMIHGHLDFPNSIILQFGNNTMSIPISDGEVSILTLSTDNVFMEVIVNDGIYSGELLSKPIVASADTGIIGAPVSRAIWGELLLYNKILEPHETKKVLSYLTNKWR